MRNSRIETILVHGKDQRIGDAYLQEPFFRSLRSRFPKAKITLVMSEGGSAYAHSLAPVTAGYLDEVIENAGICMEKAQAYAWKRPLDGRKFDLVIDMQKTWWKTLAVRRIRHRLFISASKHFLFSSRWPRSFKKPERLIDQFMMLLDAVKQEPVAALPPTVWFSPAQAALADQLLPPGKIYVAMAPGAGDRTKCWPLDRFIDLAKAQAAQGRMPVFILGPEEAEWLAPLRAAVPEAIMPGWRKPAALDPAVAQPMMVSALGSRLDVAVSNDCGTAHMLAAGGVKLVSLFGFTNGAKYQPAAPIFRRLEAKSYGTKDVASIPLADVSAAVESLLGEKPSR